MKRFVYLFLAFISLSITIQALPKTDSLKNLLENTKDTSKIAILIQLIENYSDKDSAVASDYLNKLFLIAEKSNNELHLAQAYQMKGQFLKKRGDLPGAIENFKEAENIYSDYNDFKLLTGIYNNLGATYADKGDYQSSIQVLIKGLRLCDKLDFKAIKAKTLLNIGLVFYYQKNYDFALNYYKQSLELRKQLKDKKGIALVYNNIGIIYYFKNQPDSSVQNFKKALQLFEELKNKRPMSMPLFNIAELFFGKQQYDSALSYYCKSYEIDSILKDKANCAKSLIKIAETHLAQNKTELARKTAHEALFLSKEVQSKEDIKDSYQSLSQIYAHKKDFKKALEYSELSSSMKDSLFDKQSSEMIAELQTKYETEKKDILLSNQKQVIKNQRIIAIILTAGILLALILLGFVVFEYIQKKRAYIILDVQKRNITDSINYASRIQTALLPPEDLLNELLPEHFVLYMPKDIVSGDFYWITVAANKTIIAVADCTGHGVPGAFMSMLGFAFLNEIVNKRPESNANEILNELRVKVKTSLHQNEQSITKDGMDIALAIIDPETKLLQFAGANNPLLVCRQGQIINLQPDKMPIGIHSIEKESFSIRELQLEKNDTIYLFSDGYIDQFGGEKNKKLGRVNFDQLLKEASEYPIKAQRYFLQQKIFEWMLNVDQMDDILIMGVKIE